MLIELRGLGFSAAHFIIGHTKCEHLHGHNWNVAVEVEGETDKRGLLVDFIELKKIVEKICNAYDHRLLLPLNNPALRRAPGKNTKVLVHGRKFEFPKRGVVWLPVVNVTVEELARVVADRITENLRKYPNVKKIIVTVGETKEEIAREERLIGEPK
jgi:6-pyruvoyltetrahydropterin/6-carboxytetrahydropterin synthase